VSAKGSFTSECFCACYTRHVIDIRIRLVEHLCWIWFQPTLALSRRFGTYPRSSTKLYSASFQRLLFWPSVSVLHERMIFEFVQMTCSWTPHLFWKLFQKCQFVLAFVHWFPCSDPSQVFSCPPRRPLRKINIASLDLEFRYQIWYHLFMAKDIFYWKTMFFSWQNNAMVSYSDTKQNRHSQYYYIHIISHFEAFNYLCSAAFCQ
jgi:hypothetical protein